MPEIQSVLAEPEMALEAGTVYKVESVEHITTERSGWEAYRVEVATREGVQGKVMLWVKPSVGRRSKLGAFLIALGPNTDTWAGRYFKVLYWTPKERELLEVVYSSGGESEKKGKGKAKD